MTTLSHNRMIYYISMVHYPLKTQQWIERAGRSEPVTAYDQSWLIEDIAIQGNRVQFTLINTGDIMLIEDEKRDTDQEYGEAK